jgi:hypothetical protein
LGKLTKRLLALHDQRSRIGYWADSGTHSTANMSYASLAFIHAYPVQGKHPERNIFAPVKPFVGGGSSQDSEFFKRLLKQYVKFDSRYTAENLLDTIGKDYTQRVDNVFGNTALLYTTQGGNPTPLIDSSELKDHLGYRTTINYTLKGVV